MILGLYPWQWLYLGAIIVGSSLAFVILRKVLSGFGGWFLKRFHISAEQALTRAVARSLALGIVAESTRFVLPYVGLAEATTQSIRVWVDALAISFLVIAVYRLVDLISHRATDHVLRHRRNGRDAAVTLAPLIGSGIKLLVLIIGFVTVLGYLGVNVGAILTGLSIGGAALALAAQDTIKNLFGSVMILADQPFAVGDWVVFQGAEGIVEEIGFRSTRIRTFADTIITQPNGRLADMAVENVGLRAFRRYRTKVVIDHTTPVEQVREFIEAIRGVILEHPFTEKSPERVVVVLSTISTVGLTIDIVMFAETSQFGDEAGFKHEINMGILTAADTLRIKFASQGEPEAASAPNAPSAPNAAGILE